MRGCLVVLGLGAVVLIALVAIGFPTVASVLVRQGVIAAGLDAPDLAVRVTAEPPTDLLGLHADGISITATDATWKGAQVGRLAVELTDVDLVKRSAGDVEGRLDDVLTAPDAPGGPRLAISRIDLRGPSDAVDAEVTIASAAAEAYISQRIREATGIQPAVVRLSAPDRLAVGLPGVTVEGSLAVEADGALVLRTGVPILPPVTLVAPGALPIDLTGVAVTDAALVLTGVLRGSFAP